MNQPTTTTTPTTPTPIDFDQVRVGQVIRYTYPDRSFTEGPVTVATTTGVRIGVHSLYSPTDRFTLIAPAPTPPMEEPQVLGSHVLCDDGEWVAITRDTRRSGNVNLWFRLDGRAIGCVWRTLDNPRPVPAAPTMTLDEAISLIDTTVLVNERGVVTKEYLRERFRAAFAAKGGA